MKLNRRTLLQSLGGAAAVAAIDPFLPRLSAQTTDPRRFVYWYTPVMPAPELVEPMYQKTAGPIAFSGAFEPLNAIASKVTFVRGLKNAARSLAQGSASGPHPDGGGTFLLGRGWKPGNSGDLYHGNAAVGPHSSLDQFLAQRFAEQGQGTFLSDLRVGLGNDGKNGNVDKTISVRDGRVRLRHQTPRAALAELLPLASQGPGTNQATGRRRSVLDLTGDALRRLREKLGQEDRARIDEHLDAVRSLEQRIDQAESTKSCTFDVNVEVANATREDVAQNLYIDIMKLCLACGATRVAGAQWGPHTSTLRYDFLPDKRRNAANFHQSTHTAGNEAYIRGVLNFRATQFRKLVGALDSVVEPSGKTLLDNTVVLWYTDVPRGHSDSDVFCMLAGGSHYFRHGSMVNASGNHNRALTSVVRAMGLEADTFGDASLGSGELPSSVIK